MERLNNITTETTKSQLISGKEVVVPQGVNWIIDDVGLNRESRIKIQELLNVSVEFLDPSSLSKILTDLISQTTSLEEKKLAILYPKSGGLSVQKVIQLTDFLPPSCNFREFAIDSLRTGTNQSPLVKLPSQLISGLKRGLFDSILVIDDVIVSGKTINQIQEAVFWGTDVVDYSNYIQGLRFDWTNITSTRLKLSWYAASWLKAIRPQTQARTLSRFEKVICAISYQGERGQTPVNSLSTWMYDEVKGQNVLRNYAGRYSVNAGEFMSFINNLKGGV